VSDLQQFVFGGFQQFREDLPLALTLGCREHVVVMRYTPPKPFDIAWQVGDKFGLLCQFKRSFSDVPPLRRVQCRAYRSVQPINLGAKLLCGSHEELLRIGEDLCTTSIEPTMR
jgi:hypothetical protein